MVYKSIFLEEYKKNTKVAEDILNPFGTKLVSKGEILSMHDIEVLKKNEILVIKVYDDTTKNFVSVDLEKFKRKYTKNVDDIKNIMKDVGNGKDADIKVILTIGDSMIQSLNEVGPSKVLNYIRKMKDIDNYTYNHCVNVSFLSMMIGKWLNYNEEDLKNLTYSGLLHDIGKAIIPDCILYKPGKLTPEEFEKIKKHSANGFKIVDKMKEFPKSVAIGVLMHHEREDGSGYPMNAFSNQIHEFAKIISIADIYDAMTSNRCYHRNETPFKVLEMFQNESFGKLDSNIVLTFLHNISSYYIGDVVLLNTGEEAEVSYININSISKPIVKVDNTFIDLSRETEIEIAEIL